MAALAKLACLGLGLLLGLAGTAAAAGGIGVVLLHGKTGMPGQHGKLAAALKAAGFLVATPKLCWSKDRIFDKAYADCLLEVDAAIGRLKAAGATGIVVGGTSQGAVAAIDYGAVHAGLAGIIALSPAADPVELGKYPEFRAAIDRARALQQEGKGAAVTRLDDLVSGGKVIQVTATPAAYLSFHDPAVAIATMKNLAALDLPRLTAPLLWVAGSRDPAQGSAAKSFQAAPANKQSRYVTVEATHGGVPDVAAATVIAWLKGLQ